MTTIILKTEINALPKICFDVSRNIDLHLLSAQHTEEKVIAGRMSGLCELGDEFTWEAKHFGIKQILSSRITKMNSPFYFEDTMLKGAFKSMRHEHHFEATGEQTTMRDIFMYEVPYGFFGWIFDKLILKNHMTKFIKKRNSFLKDCAEQKLARI